MERSLQRSEWLFTTAPNPPPVDVFYRLHISALPSSRVDRRFTLLSSCCVCILLYRCLAAVQTWQKRWQSVCDAAAQTSLAIPTPMRSNVSPQSVKQQTLTVVLCCAMLSRITDRRRRWRVSSYSSLIMCGCFGLMGGPSFCFATDVYYSVHQPASQIASLFHVCHYVRLSAPVFFAFSLGLFVMPKFCHKDDDGIDPKTR